MLYRKFLEVLYENDPNRDEIIKNKKLSCVEAYERLEDINRHTLSLWNVLFYWRKKRNECNTKPFLQLDLNKIIKAIDKVKKFLG
jgi:hypothetical protein